MWEEFVTEHLLKNFPAARWMLLVIFLQLRLKGILSRLHNCSDFRVCACVQSQLGNLHQVCFLHYMSEIVISLGEKVEQIHSFESFSMQLQNTNLLYWTVALNPVVESKVLYPMSFTHRLRALSSGGSVTSPPPSPAMPKYKLAEYRYGREEMLALYVKDNKVG